MNSKTAEFKSHNLIVTDEMILNHLENLKEITISHPCWECYGERDEDEDGNCECEILRMYNKANDSLEFLLNYFELKNEDLNAMEKLCR